MCGKRFANPLAPLKGAKLAYGATVQEIVPNWIQAHSYDASAETLLKNYAPTGQQMFYSANRFDKYPLTLNESQLRQAFVNDTGLNEFLARNLDMLYSSDSYDEYRIMMNLFSYYDVYWGMYKVHVDAPTNADTAQNLLKNIRAYAGRLKFPSAIYNRIDVPVFANMDELVLFITPDALASIDVDALAAAFNIARADIQMRTIIVDEFPLPNVVAILTTNDILIQNDTVNEMASFWNPETLGTSYFYHRQGVYGISPAVPLICFTTDEGTTTPVITQTVSALNITPATASVEAGGTVSLTVELAGSVTDTGFGGVSVEPNAATFAITAERPGAGASATAIPLTLNNSTYVDRYGVLHVQKRNLKTGDKLTVAARASYVNPSGETESKTGSMTVTIK